MPVPLDHVDGVGDGEGIHYRHRPEDVGDARGIGHLEPHVTSVIRNPISMKFNFHLGYLLVNDPRLILSSLGTASRRTSSPGEREVVEETK